MSTLALDCEMVEVIRNGAYQNAVGRVSIVDDNGAIVLDEFVKPDHQVSNYRTTISGITAQHLANGKSLDQVRRDILNIIKGKTLVGHDLDTDLEALGITHDKIRDTALKPDFMKRNNGQKPSLKDLARDLLNENIQVGKHDPIEDARTALKLFKKYPW